MSLAVFGTLLLGALFALCWKSGRAVTVAVVAGMLGLTLAGSNGALAAPSRQLVSSVRATVDSMAASMFGGGGNRPAPPENAGGARAVTGPRRITVLSYRGAASGLVTVPRPGPCTTHTRTRAREATPS